MAAGEFRAYVSRQSPVGLLGVLMDDETITANQPPVQTISEHVPRVMTTLAVVQRTCFDPATPAYMLQVANTYRATSATEINSLTRSGWSLFTSIEYPVTNVTANT